MEKVRCAVCGKVIKSKESILTFDISGRGLRICIGCYYKELAEELAEKRKEKGGDLWS